MKKIILTFIVIALFANVSAQLKINSSGEVEIGTASSSVLRSPNNVAITFKVNNVLAGFTGNSSTGNVSFGFNSLLNPSAGTYNTATGTPVRFT